MITIKQFGSVALKKMVLTSFYNHSKAAIIKPSLGAFSDGNVTKGGSMFYRMRTKACKRCRGDLSLEHDKYGTYVECIQCGAIWNEIEMIYPPARKKSNHKPVKPAVTAINSRD